MWSAALLNMPFDKLIVRSGDGKQRGQHGRQMKRSGANHDGNGWLRLRSATSLAGVVFCALGWNTADLFNRLVRWQRSVARQAINAE